MSDEPDEDVDPKPGWEGNLFFREETEDDLDGFVMVAYSWQKRLLEAEAVRVVGRAALRIIRSRRRKLEPRPQHCVGVDCGCRESLRYPGGHLVAQDCWKQRTGS